MIMASTSHPLDTARRSAGPLAVIPSRRTCSSETQPNSPDRSVLRFDLVLHLFDRFEVFDGLDSEFVRGRPHCRRREVSGFPLPHVRSFRRSIGWRIKRYGVDSLAYDQSPRMSLQSTRSDHVIHPTLNHLTQGQCLVLPRHNQYDLPGIHDGLHAHRQCHPWDGV